MKIWALHDNFVLSISNPKNGGAGGGYYFKYYSSHAENEHGRWHGTGASILGVTGTVSQKELNNLLEGFSPDGNTPLVQNAGNKKRQGFWDLTLSVPKSVSVLYMVAPKDLQREIEACIYSAGHRTLNRSLKQENICSLCFALV